MNTERIVAQVPVNDIPETVSGLELPAVKAKAGRPKRVVISSTPIAQTCKKCGVGYTANLVKYEDGTQNITPPRCEKCQTSHCINTRMTKAITAFKHIGNLKSRLSAEQKKVLLGVLSNELKVLMDVFAGNSTSVGAFDIDSY